jgi:hypothetical protein
MTDFEDIHTDNDQLLALNPALAAIVSPAKSAGKGSKWHNKPAKSLEGETFDSGKEADDALKFTQAVQAGFYRAYLHHVVVELPGGVKMELDHLVLNKKLQVEVYDSKLLDKATGKFICTPEWRNKKKQFEEIYGLKITLI